MNKKSRTDYSVQNIFANFIGYGLNILISFACRMVFVRVLSAEYLGVGGLFANILSVLSLSELGVGSAIGYALYKPIAENNHGKIASLMKFYGKAYRIIGCVVGVIGLCLLPFLGVIIREQPNISESLQLIYLLYLFNSASSYFFSYKSTLLTASQRGYVVTSISYAIVIIQNVLQMIFLLITKDFMSYLIIQILCGLITNIVIAKKAGHDYSYIKDSDIPSLPKAEQQILTKNIKALTVYRLSGVLVNNTDNIVITYFNGLVTTGTASNYLLLSGMLNSLLGMIFNSISASVGNLNATESEEKKYQFFNILNFSNFWLFGWASIGIAAVSTDLIHLLFGSQYVLPPAIPIILALNFYMVGMQNTVWTYKHSLGLFKQGQNILFFTAIINIIGDIVLGSKYGLVGIFAATAIARVLTNIWYDPYAVFKYGLHTAPLKYAKRYIMYLVILVVTACLTYFACSLVQLPILFSVISKLLLATLIPNFAFWLIFRKSEEFQYLRKTSIRALKRIIPKTHHNQ